MRSDSRLHSEVADLGSELEVKLLGNKGWVLTLSTQFLASSSSNTAKCFEPQVFSSSVLKKCAVFSPISLVVPNFAQSSASKLVRSSIFLDSCSEKQKSKM